MRACGLHVNFQPAPRGTNHLPPLSNSRSTCSRWPCTTSSRGPATCAIDVLNQRLDRALAPGRVSPSPPLGAKARAGISLCGLSEVPHGIVDIDSACAVGDRVSSPNDPRHPSIVTLECCGGSQWNHCVHERRLVFDLPDACEAVANQRDRVIRVSA